MAPTAMGSIAAELERLLPAGRVLAEPASRGTYMRDEAEGAHAVLPEAVVRPWHASEVAATVAYCAERGVPIVARGAGTGLSGGANAVGGGIVLSLEKMNRIVRIDRDECLAVVQPGVVNADLRAACEKAGLGYPPDPASAPWSTIGGNVATNAGGICCVKYGVTRDYVLGMEAVVGRGEIVRLGRTTAKGTAGYDLTALMVGSEGTLGIVTEVVLRARALPSAERTVVGYFGDLASAGRAVTAVLASGVVPSALELVDGFCLRAVDEWKRMGLAELGDVLLLARCDSAGAAGEAEAAAVLECFESAGAVWSAGSADPAEADALFAARRLVYPALKRLGRVLTEDVCVPRVAMPEMLARIDRIAAERGVRIANLAHAGDGNLHPMILLDRDRESAQAAAAAEAAHAALEQIIDEAIAVGGTVTGEHGVGLLKKRGLALEAGPAVLDMHRAVKRALDPAGIFNPGKIFD